MAKKKASKSAEKSPASAWWSARSKILAPEKPARPKKKPRAKKVKAKKPMAKKTKAKKAGKKKRR